METRKGNCVCIVARRTVRRVLQNKFKSTDAVVGRLTLFIVSGRITAVKLAHRQVVAF